MCPTAVLNNFFYIRRFFFFWYCSERLKKAFYPSFRSSVVVILQSRNTKDAVSQNACSVCGNSTKDLGISQVVPPGRQRVSGP
jgi:hypothetical protein